MSTNRKAEPDAALVPSLVAALVAGGEMSGSRLAPLVGRQKAVVLATLGAYPDIFAHRGFRKGSLFSLAEATGTNRTASGHYACTCSWRTVDGDNVELQRSLHELVHPGKTVAA
jgi:hypothetical protein